MINSRGYCAPARYRAAYSCYWVRIWLVQIKQGHNLPLLLCFSAGLQQQAAVVKGKANDLLHPPHNVLVAESACRSQLESVQDHTVNVLL